MKDEDLKEKAEAASPNDETDTPPSNTDEKMPPTVNATQPGAVAVKDGASSSQADTTSVPLAYATAAPGAVAVSPMHQSSDHPERASEEATRTSAAAALNTSNTSPHEEEVVEEEETTAPNEASNTQDATDATDAPTLPKPTTASSQPRGLPVAEIYQELPLIPSTMVVSVEANPVTYQVDIDAEAGHHSTTPQPFEMESAKENKGNLNRKRNVVLLIVCLILVITAVVVGLMVSRDNNKSSNSPFPYPCYTSSVDILNAQINTPLNEPLDPLILCPGTTIQMGTFRNPSRDDFNITGGDIPISAVRPNVTIQCGLDGRRENDCRITGGLSHVITQDPIWNPVTQSYWSPTASIDGFVLKGITFSGLIQGTGVFGGLPVGLSHPGRARFEDCAWVDLTASKRVIAVGRNYLMQLLGTPLDDLSVELTLSNCFFDNVSYEEEFLLLIHQAIHVENTTFRNVELSTLLPNGCGLHPDGCRNLLHCTPGGPSTASMSNVCVENFQTTGAAPIAISRDTKWSSSGRNTWTGPLKLGDSLEDAPIDDANDAAFAQPIAEFAKPEFGGGITNPVDDFGDTLRPFCALGVARWENEKGDYECLSEPVFEQTTGKCPVP